MAHKRNDDFYLYTGLTANGNECYEALQHLNQSGLPFRHLHYGDPGQHAQVISSIKDWFDEGTEVAMPFVTYLEVYDVTDPVAKVAKIVSGINNIKSTDWLSLSNFQG